MLGYRMERIKVNGVVGSATMLSVLAGRNVMVRGSGATTAEMSHLFVTIQPVINIIPEGIFNES